jgi:(1->4)-alpha-D-glucan 1-alpha-D-glucosylmutase
MPLTESAHIPLATYRVQLHSKSTFSDLAALGGYFRDLGISDLYLSPIFTSVPGSLHGYDVTDYSEVNPELGGLSGFERLAVDLKESGQGIILDFVPNHMGIAGMLNEWWRDVLENGPSSHHAPFFDIQWKTDFSDSHPKVMVPLLLDHYGKVLANGEIALVFEDGFSIRYKDTILPIRPESYSAILTSMGLESCTSPGAAAFNVIASAYSDCTAKKVEIFGYSVNPDLSRRLGQLLTDYSEIKEKLFLRLRVINGTPGNPSSFDRLHDILDQQHYRLARWQAGAHEINYRRFFAIDTLVGLHMENPEVFRECHTMLGRLLAQGSVSGLRVDHIDGLRQPEDYLNRIQTLDRSDRSKPLYLLVEKILEGRESVPQKWPVHGTTGYEFISQLSGVLVDCNEESRFDSIYRRNTGDISNYTESVVQSKRVTIAEMFANAISNLGVELAQILFEDRNWRDLTRHELTTAVSEFVAHLPVYRTYRRRREHGTAEDREVLREACAKAISDNPRADPQPFEFLRDLLIGEYPSLESSSAFKDRILNWVLTFQQYTGAIMAKAVEDTVFYNYNRFIALNEVGCDPSRFGASAEDFHRANLLRAEFCPLALLTSSTHDSKFSEDIRARLYALSELGGEWDGWIAAWKQKTSRHTTVHNFGAMPDSSDQYRFFQILLGVWPFESSEVDDAFRSRLKEYLRKAVSEAKRHTSILNNNELYLLACDDFVDGVTNTDSSNDFLLHFEPCASRIARLGMVNSLVQLVLKCTVPGIPDFYQGNETWDFSLVDPDNRRSVDFAFRKRQLSTASESSYSDLLIEWRNGAIKMRVTRDLLKLRGALPHLFSHGSYRAVSAIGFFSGNVLAFERNHEDGAVLVVVPRLSSKIGCPPLGPTWDNTRIEYLGEGIRWKDAFTGFVHNTDRPLFLRDLFANLPFAVLCQQKEDVP